MIEYTPAAQQGLGEMSRNEVIAVNYHSRYTVKEIIGFLAVRHGIAISERQVHRILRGLNLYRRNNQSPLEEVIPAVVQELAASANNAGYRQVRQRLLVNHGICATSELVRLVLLTIDPTGVLSRKSHKLQRRIYTNKGPNYAIHMDGWDELKPFGISVHGAVDGYSRRVLWLRACNSNKKPQYIAQFYVDYLKQINGMPVRVYSDSIVRDIQYALPLMDQDPFQGQSSFIYVSLNRNVRIERFWRTLRAMCGNSWMNEFKDLCDLEVLDTSDNLHLEIVRFCFLGLVNKDLDNVRRLWNEHRVRASRFCECPAGKPDVLFFQPEVSGGRDYKFPLPTGIDAIAKEYCEFPPAEGVSMEFKTLAQHIIQQRSLVYPPQTFAEATALFLEIATFVDQLQ